MSLRAGVRLGRYEIRAPIGAGGMGEVYRARDGQLERDVAIKVLPEHLAESPAGAGAVRTRGEGGGGALASEYSGDLRCGLGGGGFVRCHRSARGRDAEAAAGQGGDGMARGGRDRSGGGGRARGGAWQGDYSSRSEAAQHFSDGGGAREDPGFRTGAREGSGGGSRGLEHAYGD